MKLKKYILQLKKQYNFSEDQGYNIYYTILL